MDYTKPRRCYANKKLDVLLGTNEIYLEKLICTNLYMNGNNSHNTYFIPVGGLYIDKSHMYSVQIQNSNQLYKKKN